MIGPLLAGLLSARFGPATAVAGNACGMLLAAVLVAATRFGPRPARASGEDHLSQLREMLAGFQFLRRESVLLSVALFSAAFNLIVAAGVDLFVFHLKHEFHASDATVGLVFAVAGIGGVLGAVAAPATRRRFGFGICFLGGVAMDGAMLMGIGLAPSVALLMVFVALFIFSDTQIGVVAISLRQEITPDHLLGRVTAALWIVMQVPAPIGAAVGTTVAAHVGAPVVLTAMGAWAVLLAVVGLLTPLRTRRPELRAARYAPDAAFATAALGPPEAKYSDTIHE